MLLLGQPRVVHASGHAAACERKAAALLTYLALEGPTSRGDLATLLWPAVTHATARNNLVHLLRRTKYPWGDDLVRAEGATLALGDVTSDAADVLRGDVDAAPEGELLAGMNYDETPDFAEWLLAARERVEAARTLASHGELARLERDGRVMEALALAARVLTRDPLNEDVWRASMRLHYLNGDRPAALQTYGHARDTLRQHLGASPSAETVALAEAIDAGSLPHGTPRARIPVSVRRPPLVGRDDVWARMEDAWAHGKAAVLVGPPGSGKTRLAMDFLATKSGFTVLRFEGRPGDEAAAYTTHARNYAEMFAAYPDLNLPAWARRELARMLPAFGDPPPPMTSDADKLRFYEAKTEAIRLALRRGPMIICSDDLQFMDDGSIEAGAYVFSQLLGDEASNLRSLFCYRTGELSPTAEVILERMVAGGIAVPIALPPLDERDVEDLLATLRVPNAARLARSVHEFARGNPQFMLEAVKAMYETDDFGEGAVLRALPRGLQALVEGRLARLTPSALNAARAAAVLRSDFTVELVARTLGASLGETLLAWEELEDAQLVHGERFQHDLILEAVLSGIPPTVRTLLHRASARVLAANPARAAHVAQHWLDGGDLAEAATWLERAAKRAEDHVRFREAGDFYARAADVHARLGRDEAARTARERSAAARDRAAPNAARA